MEHDWWKVHIGIQLWEDMVYDAPSPRVGSDVMDRALVVQDAVWSSIVPQIRSPMTVFVRRQIIQDPF